MLPTNQERVWASGRVAVLGIGALLADTGALPAGVYDILIHIAVSDAVIAGAGAFIEHRNAANAATVKDLGGAVAAGGAGIYVLENYRLAANERIRLVGGPVACGAGSLAVGAIGYARIGKE